MNDLRLGVRGNVTIRDLNKFLDESGKPVSPRASPNTSPPTSKNAIRVHRNATSTAVDANFDFGDEG
jgi:hypothetical protein